MHNVITRRNLMAGAAGLALAATSNRSGQAQSRLRIVVATGGTGGVYYPYGGGLAKILSEKLANVQATAQVTGGSIDNIKLLQAGDVELGFATLDSAYDALVGEGAYAKEGKHDVRVVAVLYDSFLHVIADRSRGIGSIAQLKGRRVSVGSSGSATESIADRVLEAAGLDPKKDVTRDNLGVGESGGALKDGKIAAFFWIGGVPTAAVRDLASPGGPPLTFVPTGAEFTKLETTYPGQYRPFLLDKSSYNGMDTDVAGLGVANVLVTSSRVSDKVVSTILGGMFDNLEDIHKIHPEARRLTLKTAAIRTAVPFHPAADAFYKAKGVAN